MNDCAKYLELISAYADNERSGADKEQLERHLAECESCACLLNAYREISRSLSEEISPAPDSLCDGVMQKIAKLPESNKKRFSAKTVLTRYIPAAACLAVILIAAPRLSNLGCSSSAPDMMNMAMSGGGATSASVADVPSGGEGYSEGDADTGNADASYYLEGYEKAEMPGAPPPAMPESAPELMDTPEPEDGDMVISAHEEGIPQSFYEFYAVVTVTGEFPELLGEYRTEDIGGGMLYIYIPQETALKLIDMGYDAEIYDKNSWQAVVIYTP